MVTSAGDWVGVWPAETLPCLSVSDLFMKPIWTLRQLLAWLRGLTIMVALFWALVLIQLVSALVTGGFSGLRGQFVRVATAGVPPEEQNIAVRKMYEALGVTAIAGCVLYMAQRYLGRKVHSHRKTWDRT